MIRIVILALLLLHIQGQPIAGNNVQDRDQNAPPENKAFYTQIDEQLRMGLRQAYAKKNDLVQLQHYESLPSHLNRTHEEPHNPEMIRVKNTLAYPWIFVGQLQIQFHAMQYNGCTATMIAPKILITASHCFYDPTYGEYKSAQFFPARSGDVLSYPAVTVERVSHMGKSGKDFDNNMDVAFVYLERAPYPPDFWASWKGIAMAIVSDPHFQRTPTTQTRLGLTVAGYPVSGIESDQMGYLHMVTTTTYRNTQLDAKFNQIEHKALSFEGTSGGPIFAYDPLYETFAMVGVISSQRTWKNGEVWAVGIKFNQSIMNRIQSEMRLAVTDTDVGITPNAKQNDPRQNTGQQTTTENTPPLTITNPIRINVGMNRQDP